MSGPVGVLLDRPLPAPVRVLRALLEGSGTVLCPLPAGACPTPRGPEAEQTWGSFSPCAVSPLRLPGPGTGFHPPLQIQRAAGLPQGLRPLSGPVRPRPSVRAVDLITWVPALGPKRRRERGYDQAFLLASAAAHELGEVAGRDPAQGAQQSEAQSGLTGDEDRPGQCPGRIRCAHAERWPDRRVLLHGRCVYHRRDPVRMCPYPAHRGGRGGGGVRHAWPGRTDGPAPRQKTYGKTVEIQTKISL